jgi:hypothetical protein
MLAFTELAVEFAVILEDVTIITERKHCRISREYLWQKGLNHLGRTMPVSFKKHHQKIVLCLKQKYKAYLKLIIKK